MAAFNLLQASKHDVYPFIDPHDGLKDAAAGKSVLVTGAGTGIGKAVAEIFALAGATELIICARRTEPLEQTKADIAKLVPSCKVTVFGGVDVSDHDAVKKLFASLPSVPDVLVQSAGMSTETYPLAESDPTDWLRVIDINIKGTYLIARAYTNAVYAARKKGCLINISSNASWRYIPGRSGYAASKIAVNSMTEYIHNEGESKGITCIAMHPGGVVSGMTSDDLPEAVKRILIDTPALPAGTAVYLSTDRARFLGGRFVVATWNMEELEGQKERIEREDLLKTKVLGVTES